MRRSRSNLFCNSSRLAKSGITFVASELQISCQYGCSDSAISLPHYCIEYSVEDDWTYLEGHGAYNFSFNDITATIGNIGYAWVAPFDNAHWNISTTFSPITRPDTGQINSSPRVASFPYVYLPRAYRYRYRYRKLNAIIPLAVSDPDNDIIRCRWANGTECRGVCNNFTGAWLDSESCTIRYLSRYRGTGLKVAAIMIEDFLPGSSVPLSSVAHQFLVKVVNVPRSCYSLPRFVPPTLSQGTCINVPPGTIFTRQLTATSGCSGVTITAIKIIAPNGTSKGELCHVLGTNKYSTNITWTPSVSQQNDTHFLCYVAVSSNNLTSQQSCIKLAAGYHPPMPLPETATPNNLLYSSSNATLQIVFDRKIQRPSTPAFIKFYKFGEVVHRIDTSSSSEVEFHGQTLTIVSNYSFVEGVMYYVNFDEGVVTSIEGCHLSNEPIHSETFWKFQMINLTPS